MREKSLFGCGRFEKANCFTGPPNQPPGANQKVNGVLKKSGLIAFNGMTDKLQNPAADEKRQRDSPMEKEKWPRNGNHRDAKRVTKLVQRVLMFSFVVVDERIHYEP